MRSNEPQEFPKMRYLKELYERQFQEMLVSGVEWGATDHEKTQEISELLVEAYEWIAFLLLFLKNDEGVLIPEIAGYWEKKGRLKALAGTVVAADGLLDRIAEDFTALPRDAGSP